MGSIETYKKQFKYYKSLADKAIQQIDEKQFFTSPSDNSNSVAVIVKHIAGNMLSRWTDVFDTDGEKEWRQRDQEFEIINEDVESLLAYWERAWEVLFSLLDTITESDLNRIIYIRNMGHTLDEALVRQICHYPYHIGQIVYVCRWLAGSSFKSLSIPKGNSQQYNQDKFSKEKSKKHFTEDL